MNLLIIEKFNLKNYDESILKLIAMLTVNLVYVKKMYMNCMKISSNKVIQWKIYFFHVKTTAFNG